jgi:hypothetical protein
MPLPSIVDTVRRRVSRVPQRLTYRDALLPLVVMMGVAVVLSFAYRPFFGRALAVRLPPGIPSAELEALQAQVFRFSAIGSALVPLAQVGVAAALAFLILAAFEGRDLPRFGGLAACVAWAALLLTLKDVARYGVLRARGVDAVRDVTDLRPGIGIGGLLADAQSPVYSALDAINAFDLAYLYVLARVIARSEQVPFRHALTAAAVPWLLLQAVRVAFSAVLGG